MSSVIPPHLEARLREIARQRGIGVDAFVEDLLVQYANSARPGANGAGSTGTSVRYPLRGTVVRYDEPFGPASGDTDWEALR